MTSRHAARRLGAAWLVMTVVGLVGWLACCRPASAATDVSRLAVRAGSQAHGALAGGGLNKRSGAMMDRIVTLHVYTVPPEPGVKLQFDGLPVTTGPDGVAVIQTPYQLAGHTLRLVTPDFSLDHGRVQVKFTVWRSPLNAQKHSTTLTHLVLRRNHAIQLGFRVSYKVGFSFVTPDNQHVPSVRVSGVELRADGGYLNSVNGGQTIRLLGVLPIKEAGILVAHDVNYTLENVIVDGSNVVNVGQQRVSPVRQQSAKFILQLRQLTITAHDRLFGMSVGSAVVLTYPNGHRVTYRFGRTHRVVLTDLARGQYHVQIHGGGLFTSQNIVLSRNQIVNMPVFTDADIIAVLVILAIVMVAAIVRQRRGARAAYPGGQSG